MRPRRRERSMYEIGGWVFADLLLALTLIFMVSGTGDPPPTPTPTATANLLATSDAQVAQLQGQAAENAQTATADALVVQQTVEANATADALLARRATASAQAAQTRAAQTDSQRATVDARATQAALESQVTISAFATEQAGQDSSVADLTSQQATVNAAATQSAATSQAQAVQAQATIDALSTQQAASQADAGALQTAEANAADISAQSTEQAVALQTAQARITLQDQSQSILETQAAGALATNEAQGATAGGLSNQVIQLRMQFDRQGLANNSPGALDEAQQEIEAQIGPYADAGCQIGFMILEGNSGISEGNALADRVFGLIQQQYPDIASEAGSYSAANTNEDGRVDIQMTVYEGCPLIDSGQG